MTTPWLFLYAVLLVTSVYGQGFRFESPSQIVTITKTVTTIVPLRSSRGLSSVSASARLNYGNRTTKANACKTIDGVCYECGISAHGIGLNSWWSDHYRLTAATVFHHFLQYQNTRITAKPLTCGIVDASAILGSYDADEPPTTVSGLPTDLIPGATEASAYGYSVLTTMTESSIGGRSPTVLVSPTAWIQGPGNITVMATRYSDGNIVRYLNITKFFTPTAQSGDYTFIQKAMEAHPTYSGSIATAMPDSMFQQILAYWKTVPDIDWPLGLCTQWREMGGEPTAHIPVNVLTATSSITRTMNEDFSSGSQAPTAALACEHLVSTNTAATYMTSATAGARSSSSSAAGDRVIVVPGGIITFVIGAFAAWF